MEKLDGIASKIKDKTWKVKFEKKEIAKVETTVPKLEKKISSVDTKSQEILDAINQFK